MRRNPITSCCLCWFFGVRWLCVPHWGHADDIVISMSAAFSGPSASLGTELYRGSIAYITHINSVGGVNGHKLVLKVYDDQYDPVSAVENTITLVETDRVFLLFDLDMVYYTTVQGDRFVPISDWQQWQR